MGEYEVVRTGKSSGFQRCGHKHKSRKAAEKCHKKHGGSAKGWRIS
jgi:hypothetical protein